jgi:hypothetical protein
MFRKQAAEIQAGDIIGFSGWNWISALINMGSFGIPFWSISHVGIMAEHNGKLLLFESTTLNTVPCEVTGKRISGSQAHPLEHNLQNYNGAIWHYPLYRPLFDHERLRLNEFLVSTIGRPYDAIGAFRSGGAGFSWLESQFREADLHSLFCSEWCAAAHAEIGLFTTDNGSRWSPNHLTRRERRLGILRRPRRLK